MQIRLAASVRAAIVGVVEDLKRLSRSAAAGARGLSGCLLVLLLAACGGGGATGDDSDAGDGSDTQPTPALGAPASVAVTPGDRQLRLTWDPVAHADGYRIYYAAESGVTPANHTGLADGASLQVASAAATLNGLVNGTTYYAVVTAFDRTGRGDPSVEVSGTPAAPAPPPPPPPPPPATPSGLTANPGDGEVMLSWNAVASATHYNVYYATEPGVSAQNYPMLDAGATVASAANLVSIRPLSNGTAYYFVVTAANADGESAATNEVNARPTAPPQPPATPTGLTATAGDGEVLLAWDVVANAAGYNVYYAAEAGVTSRNFATLAEGASAATAASGMTIAPLSNGTSYYFVVTAANADGESTASDEVNAEPAVPPSSDASLSALALSNGALLPLFDPAVTAYSASVGVATDSITVTAATADAGATLTVAGMPVQSGIASDPLALAVGANPIEIRVTAGDAITARAYMVTVTRQGGAFAQQAFLKAANTTAGDELGYAIALDGDTLVVGAPFEGSNATGVDGDADNEMAPQAGAVYVFTRDTAGDWSQQAYLKASNTDNGDTFGISVALSGDTLAVGAPGESNALSGIGQPQGNNSAADAGAVYVFTRDGAGVWSQQAYLKASNTGAADAFGASIALSGDTLAAGAPFEDSNATGIGGEQSNNLATTSGAVYIFARDAGAWSQQAYVKASNAAMGDQFGYALALDGDTLAVGAPEEDSADGMADDDNAPNSGAVYVLTRNGVGWSEQAYIKAGTVEMQDYFGNALALDGDTLAVGAMREDSNAAGVDSDETNDSAFNAGAVWVFTRSGSTWMRQAYLKASNTGASDLFGFSLSLDGDRLLVGAPEEDSAGTTGGDGSDDSLDEAGAAYLFTRDGGGIWQQAAYLKARNPGEDDEFGIAVAVSGDTLAAGAHNERSSGAGVDPTPDDLAADAGAVYVYRPQPPPP